MSDPDDVFDFSQWNFPEERIWIRIPEWEMIVKICTFIPLIVFGLFGNLIILRLIVLNRSLRTPTNLIIANMAFADLLSLLICPALFMVNDFYQNYKLGCIGCKMEGFLEATFLMTAVLNLSIVSYDRLTAIVLPSETRLTIRGTKVVIVLTWLTGALIALPLAIYRYYRVRQWKNFREMYCKENLNILPKYWYVLITVLVWLPLGVMLICYTAIFYKLDRYEKRVLNREHPLNVSYKRAVARTLFIVVIVFVALRLPFTLLVILREKIITPNNNMVDSSFRIYSYISQYLMFVNAAVNPLIYGFNNDNFRRAYDQTPLFRRCQNRDKNRSNPTRANNSETYGYLRRLRCCLADVVCCICLRHKHDIDVTDCQNLAYFVATTKISEGHPRMIPGKETKLNESLGTIKFFAAEKIEQRPDLSEGFI